MERIFDIVAVIFGSIVLAANTHLWIGIVSVSFGLALLPTRSKT